MALCPWGYTVTYASNPICAQIPAERFAIQGGGGCCGWSGCCGRHAATPPTVCNLNQQECCHVRNVCTGSLLVRREGGGGGGGRAPGSAAAQLVVDAARLVALRAHHVQPAQLCGSPHGCTISHDPRTSNDAADRASIGAPPALLRPPAVEEHTSVVARHSMPLHT